VNLTVASRPYADIVRTFLKEGSIVPKEAIHPDYHATEVRCACGNKFETRSTHKGDIVLEICNACHPFFTGKQKMIDTAGRIERFRRKYAKSDDAKTEAVAK